MFGCNYDDTAIQNKLDNLLRANHEASQEALKLIRRNSILAAKANLEIALANYSPIIEVKAHVEFINELGGYSEFNEYLEADYVRELEERMRDQEVKRLMGLASANMKLLNKLIGKSLNERLESALYDNDKWQSLTAIDLDTGGKFSKIDRLKQLASYVCAYYERADEICHNDPRVEAIAAVLDKLEGWQVLGGFSVSDEREKAEQEYYDNEGSRSQFKQVREILVTVSALEIMHDLLIF
ncbi:hypothetical protein M0C34_04155 [Agarivorans sp. TSD2052]|uniref:hypothetical protein n=1 Tax=Agarivorans sp. TSD2052 TaxID=2937286 RepID=UPI00200CC1D9|nr:hypothetical protein [Agarivorans sp. TSD2052]UPW19480.1 hypothetical protein M0C34_04155 [Agarivorans sp. TSD2052]